MLLVDEKYHFNLINTYKDGTKLYKCKEYKTKFKCQAFIKMENEQILDFSNEHNHNPNENKIKKDEIRKEIKSEIKNSRDPFSIKIPKLYKSVSVDKGIRGPSFDSIKSGLYKELNKNFPNDVQTFETIPEESIYYKTLDNQDFLAFKNDKIIIFQSPNLAKIQIKFGNLVFCDATFYSCPSFAYQLFITRVYDSTKNVYYTTSFTIMKGKSKNDYELVFRQLNENIKKHLDFDEEYYINELHTDFEIQIGEACRMIYPNVQIKYYIWHMKRALINKMNSLCKREIEEDDDLLILYNMINNLYFCHLDYVKIVFNKIKENSDNENFDKFLKYFDDNYIKIYKINNWNYYNNLTMLVNHIMLKLIIYFKKSRPTLNYYMN